VKALAKIKEKKSQKAGLEVNPRSYHAEEERALKVGAKFKGRAA